MEGERDKLDNAFDAKPYHVKKQDPTTRTWNVTKDPTFTLKRQ